MINNRDSVKKVIKAGLFVSAILVVVIYSFFSFKDYIKGPEIIIKEPLNGSTISTSTVMVKGQVLHIQNITINNRPILIDKEGNFTETLLLFPGYNVSVISAKDKFNRTIEYKLELVYKK